MHVSWVLSAGRLSVSFFLLAMGVLLAATVMRAILGATWTAQRAFPRLVPEGAQRFLFEYLGNVDFERRADVPQPLRVERRRNMQTRLRMEWVKEQLEERGFSASERETFLEDLREVVREGVASDETVRNPREGPPPG